MDPKFLVDGLQKLVQSEGIEVIAEGLAAVCERFAVTAKPSDVLDSRRWLTLAYDFQFIASRVAERKHRYANRAGSPSKAGRPRRDPL